MKNPRAFPRPIGNNGVNEYNESQRGMTLRDYFACEAMHVLMLKTTFECPDIAQMAYRQADAMLKYRDNKEVEK